MGDAKGPLWVTNRSKTCYAASPREPARRWGRFAFFGGLSIKIAQAPGFKRAFNSAPGVPVVAFNELGEPLGIGLYLSGDADNRATAINTFAKTMTSSSAQIAGVEDVISAIGDFGTSLNFSHVETPDIGGGALALVMDVAGLAQAAESGHSTALKVSLIKVGIDGVDLINKVGLFGHNPWVNMGVQVIKLSGASAGVYVSIAGSTGQAKK